MKPNELRIGNLVKNEIGIIKVYLITQHDIQAKTLCENAWPFQNKETFEPIPLTPEWLERFGFEFDYETGSWSILTSLEKFDYCFEISNMYKEFYQPDFLAIDIKYVHQLQNLYHALTGEELILNSEK